MEIDQPPRIKKLLGLEYRQIQIRAMTATKPEVRSRRDDSIQWILETYSAINGSCPETEIRHQ
jgi:hypothetical protein